MLQHRRRRPVLIDQLRRRLLPHPRDPRHVVDGVPRQRLHLDRLLRPVPAILSHLRHVDEHVRLHVIHPRVGVQELPQVLVLGHDDDVEALALQPFDHRRDDVVGLESVLAVDRHPRVPHDLQDPRLLRPEIVRRRLPVGLVFRINLLPEHPLVPALVDHHRQVFRPLPLHKVQQHLREHERRLRRLAVRPGQIAERREISPVDLRVPVNDVKSLAHRQPQS